MEVTLPITIDNRWKNEHFVDSDLRRQFGGNKLFCHFKRKDDQSPKAFICFDESYVISPYKARFINMKILRIAFFTYSASIMCTRKIPTYFH